jgi:DNA polymerase-3 subunit alpha
VLAALGAAVAEGTRAADDRRSGQGALFGVPAADTATDDDYDGVDDARAVSPADTLRIEYEVLGFYLSGHPLEERAGLFGLLSSTTTRNLATLPGGAEVTLGGLIVGFKEVVTKAGKKMARFRLEDLHGGVPVVVFPRTYEEYRGLLADDSVVICRAKLEDRAVDDTSTNIGLLLEEVMDLDKALANFKGVLVVQLAPGDQDKVPALIDLVGAHRGRSRLFLDIDGIDGQRRRIRTGERHAVTISENLAKSIEGLLGQGRAKLARM